MSINPNNRNMKRKVNKIHSDKIKTGMIRLISNTSSIVSTITWRCPSFSVLIHLHLMQCKMVLIMMVVAMVVEIK